MMHQMLITGLILLAGLFAVGLLGLKCKDEDR